MQSALLVSDIGKYFCDPDWHHRIVRDKDIPALEQKARQIAAYIDLLGERVPLIYTSWIEARGNADLFNKAQHIVQAKPGRDLMIEKKHSSSFMGTKLKAGLDEKGVGHLYIVGFETSGCVRATALDAVQQGLKVTVISDLCADHPDLPYLKERGFIERNELALKLRQQKTGLAEMKSKGVRFITADEAFQELVKPENKPQAAGEERPAPKAASPASRPQSG